MAIAYVLMNSELGQGSKIESELKKIDEVKEVYAIYGVYDYLAKVETGNMRELKEVVSNKIRKIDHVISTLTLITIE